jgi:hypothetical protein
VVDNNNNAMDGNQTRLGGARDWIPDYTALLLSFLIQIKGRSAHISFFASKKELYGSELMLLFLNWDDMASQKASAGPRFRGQYQDHVARTTANGDGVTRRLRLVLLLDPTLHP